MKNEAELVKIGFIAPVIAIIILSFWGGVFILVISPVVWVFSSIICIASLCLFHYIFTKFPAIKQVGFPVAVVSGALFGLLFYILFFWGKEYDLELAMEYSLVGFLVGAIAGLMYFKGPFKVNA